MESPYSIRLPHNLRSLLDIAASNEGGSLASIIIEACWKHLDGMGKFLVSEETNSASVSIPDSPLNLLKMNPAMEKFTAILTLCEKTIEQDMFLPVPSIQPLPMCSYREYDTETGETYACGLTSHSGKIKHTRGRTL